MQVHFLSHPFGVPLTFMVTPDPVVPAPPKKLSFTQRLLKRAGKKKPSRQKNREG